jgi:hypothetical protein
MEAAVVDALDGWRDGTAAVSGSQGRWQMPDVWAREVRTMNCPNCFSEMEEGKQW